MVQLSRSASVVVTRAPSAVWDLVTDIARTGEWSPVCRACWWEDGGGPQVGAWFGGRNEADGQTWETRSRVVAADRGREFAWLVGDLYTRWGYTMDAVDGGTELTETWDFRPAGVAFFRDKYGPAADARIALRSAQARDGIPATLAAIARILER